MPAPEPNRLDADSALKNRALPQGGFAAFPGGDFCPASSAWAILALPQDHALARSARTRLARAMTPSGSLPIHPDHPQAPWPTAPALMALLGPEALTRDAERLAAFLLGSSGAHWPQNPEHPTGHDTSLRGWSWTEGAHSWAEPTALVMLALSAAGHSGHPRLHEAREMLMDRQMPSGGWNYGNVRVFGARLVPDLVNTSAALCSLAGRAAPGTVARSLEYLEAGAKATRAPLSLAWAALALGSWGLETKDATRDARQRLPRLMAEHPLTGPLDTATLTLAAIALASPDGLAAHLARRTAPHAA